MLAFVQGGGVCLSHRRVAVRCSAVPDARPEAATRPSGMATGYNRVEPMSPYYPMPSPIKEAAATAVDSSGWHSVPEMWEKRAGSNLLALVDEHHDEKVRLTFAQAYELVGSFAAGMDSLGVRKGDVMSLFAESSARGVIADAAITSNAAAVAARGTNAPLDELQYIYEHSGSVGLVVDDAKTMRKLLAKLPPSKIKFVVLLWGSVPDDIRGYMTYTFQNVVDLGRQSPRAAARTPRASRDNVAAMLYTSGTTGNPKAVQLTHDNLLHQLTYISIGDRDPCPGNVFVSILPVWHIFEKTAQYFFLSKGVCVVFSNTRQFRNDLAKHRPHYLVGVPRVFETIYNGVMTKMEKASAVQKNIFFFFWKISKVYIHLMRELRGLAPGREPVPFFRKIACLVLSVLLFPLYLMAQLLVWKKIRNGVGGRLRGSICGGGKIAAHLEDFFEAAKLDIFVGYGLTETSPVITNRVFGHNVRGSVGVLAPGTQVKVVDPETKAVLPRGQQGLVCVKGLQVMKGYYKNEEANRKVFDIEGYFDTGDLGWQSFGGDLVISGRHKDVIVLSNGENIEPEIIEAELVESPLISQVMLVGQDERFLGALVVPNMDVLAQRGWVDKDMVEIMLEKQDVDGLRQYEDQLMQISDLKNLFEVELTHRVKSRRGYRAEERIQRWRLLLEPFTEENRLLTQTLKVKRNVVSSRYQKEIAQLYA